MSHSTHRHQRLFTLCILLIHLPGWWFVLIIVFEVTTYCIHKLSVPIATTGHWSELS